MDGLSGKKLTLRERQIFNSLLLGKSVKKIAEHYGLTQRTVSSWKRKILDKVGVRDVDELIRKAEEQKWMDDLPDPDRHVVYTSIEDAAGPQARFIVGTKGSGYCRFEQRVKLKKLGIYTEKILDMEYTNGYKGIDYEKLSDYRRVYPTYYLCKLQREATWSKYVEVAPFNEGFILVMYGGQRNAATERVSREFVREQLEFQKANPAFKYLTRRNYLMAATTSGQSFAPETMVDLTTGLSLANDTWYTISNSGRVPLHYKQVLTTDADPTYGDAANAFRHTLEPKSDPGLYLQESGVKLWVWCDHGTGVVTVSEAQ